MGHVRFRLHTRVMLAVTGLALVLAAGGCKRLFEVANCQSAAEKACDKWFDCWPGVSALAWGTTAGCKTSLRARRRGTAPLRAERRRLGVRGDARELQRSEGLLGADELEAPRLSRCLGLGALLAG
jgi:hypothetical protein